MQLTVFDSIRKLLIFECTLTHQNLRGNTAGAINVWFEINARSSMLKSTWASYFLANNMQHIKQH